MITTNKDKEISQVVSQALVESNNKTIIQIEESLSGLTELKVSTRLFIKSMKKGCF